MLAFLEAFIQFLSVKCKNLKTSLSLSLLLQGLPIEIWGVLVRVAERSGF